MIIEHDARSSAGQQAADRRFQALVQENTDIYWVLTPQGEMLEASASWERFTGQTELGSLGWGWRDAFHPADLPEIDEAMQQAISGRHSSETVGKIRCHSGKYRSVSLRAIPVLEPETCVSELVICGKDVTRRKLYLQMNEAQIQLALKASRVGMWDWDVVGDQTTWSDQLRALFAWPKNAPVNYRTFLAAIHPDDRNRVDRLHSRALAGGKEFITEYRVIWPDGSLHWFADRARCIYNHQGKPIHMIGATIDITDLKNTEKRLCESDLRLSRFINSNIIGITISNLDGTICEANDAFLSLVGYTRADLQAGRLNWLTLTAPEFLERERQAMAELHRTGNARPFEKEYLSRDGKRMPVLIGTTLLHKPKPPDERGLVICFILDISAQKELERQKDFSLGVTSHELKTPLAALKGTLQLARRRVKRYLTTHAELDPESADLLDGLFSALDTSVRQVDIQTRLINDILDISRISSGTLKISLKQADLAHLVRETVEDVRVAAPDRTISLSLPEATPVPVQLDPERIRQVLTNYLSNALRYSAVDKPIEVRLEVADEYAYVGVRDRGPGLSEKDRQSLWQCYHKVKGIEAQSGTGKGLGLGLYICKTLIAEHHGEVGVESTPGKGSTFWFRLPLISDRTE